MNWYSKIAAHGDRKRKERSLYWLEGRWQNLTVDSAIEYAKKTRELAERLKYLLNLKTNTTKKVGTDYKFNQEGNQTQYKYNIDVLTEIDFDRNVINTLYKKLLNKADTLSLLRLRKQCCRKQ